MLRYCRNCVMPETKPDLHIDEVRIHPSALTREQIEALAANPGAPGPSSSASATPARTMPTVVPGIGMAIRPIPTLQSQLPACKSHSDCDAGNYCARDNFCHPDSHAPK